MPALEPGFRISAHRTFTQKDVRAYEAVAIGREPRPLGPMTEAGAFGRPVVPGSMIAMMFDTLISRELTERHAGVMGQMLKFTRPVYVGETVTVTVEVVSIQEVRKLAHVVLRASTGRGMCVDGEAVVTLGQPPAVA